MGDDLRLVYLTGRTSAVDKYPLAILKAIKIEPFDTRRGHVIHVPVEKYFPLRGNGGGIGAEAQCQPGTVLPQCPYRLAEFCVALPNNGKAEASWYTSWAFKASVQNSKATERM